MLPVRSIGHIRRFIAMSNAACWRRIGHACQISGISVSDDRDVPGMAQGQWLASLPGGLGPGLPSALRSFRATLADSFVKELSKSPTPNVEVTGAARPYRAASVWTAGLDRCRITSRPCPVAVTMCQSCVFRNCFPTCPVLLDMVNRSIVC